MSPLLQAVSRGALAATGMLGALALGGEARAQEQGAAIDEVVVTAARRPEAIGKVAASVTAISQAALDNIGANDLVDAVTTVPNLHTTVANDLSIRGVGSNLFTPSAGGTPVALHIDGVYTNDRGVLTRSTYDLERIEVLRGPQGTLYGRNATGGVVNIITAGAKDSFSASAETAFESGDDVTVRGAINLPVAPNLAFRVAGFAEAGDGFQDNSGVGHDGDAPDYLSGRVSVKWSPIAALTWNASLTSERDRTISGIGQYAFFLDQNGQPFPTHLPPDETPPLSPSQGGLALGDNVTDNFADRNRADLDTLSARSNLRWTLNDALSLTYVAGYARSEDNGSTNAIPFILRISATKTEEASHEITANYEGARWHGVAGLYHFSNVTHDNNLIHIWIPDGQNEPELTPAIDQINQNARSVDTTDAVFGQATVSLTHDLRLTLGARYTRDKIATGGDTQSSCPFGTAASPFQNGFEVPLFGGATTCGALNVPLFSQVVEIPAVTAQFSHPSYLGALEYDVTPHILTYASVSTGYRTGGVSETNPAIVLYRPETSINYEAGLRARVFDNRLSLNLTAFREIYRDMQVQTLAIPNPVTINAAEATINGVEGEYIWAMSHHDRLAGYVTWLDGAFDKFPNAFSNFRNTGTDAKGNALAQTPEWSARVSYSHIFDLNEAGRITSTLQSYWQDVSFAWYTNNPEDKIPSFFRSDLIVRYETPNDRVSVEGFVNNIEDYRNVSSIFPAIGVGRMQWDLYSRGRIAGVRLGVHF